MKLFTYKPSIDIYKIKIKLVSLLWISIFLHPKFFKMAKQLASQFLGGERNFIHKQESTYFGDGFATTHFVSFLQDKAFIEKYNKGFELIENKRLISERDSKNIAWRAHITSWAANQALSLKGDFIECGVWYGILSRIILEEISEQLCQTERKFYLVDTWGDPKFQENNHPDYKEDIFEIVKKRFSNYPNAKLIRGSVPDILSTLPIRPISYLAIDMNGHKAERACLDILYSRVERGGIIYFDDYGWDYPDLRKTVDDFFKDRNETLLNFPSGNSIVIKSY